MTCQGHREFQGWVGRGVKRLEDLPIEGMREAGPANGAIHSVGSPTVALPLGKLAPIAYASRDGARANATQAAEAQIEESVNHRADGERIPFGTTMVVVAVDDGGNIVNPRLVEGQLVGGIVREVGESLLEPVAHDEEGQPFASSLKDNAIPGASDLQQFEMDRAVMPSPRNAPGVKGLGEAGAIHTPPAIVNAVADALRLFDVGWLDLPLTSEKRWRVNHGGGNRVR